MIICYNFFRKKKKKKSEQPEGCFNEIFFNQGIVYAINHFQGHFPVYEVALLKAVSFFYFFQPLKEMTTENLN